MSRREMWTDEMHDRVENLKAEVVQLRATIQEMASVLREIDAGGECIVCGSSGPPGPDPFNDRNACSPTCALDAALRKAGVR